MEGPEKVRPVVPAGTVKCPLASVTPPVESVTPTRGWPPFVAVKVPLKLTGVTGNVDGAADDGAAGEPLPPLQATTPMIETRTTRRFMHAPLIVDELFVRAGMDRITHNRVEYVRSLIARFDAEIAQLR
jgi:hypothetical protein